LSALSWSLNSVENGFGNLNESAGFQQEPAFEYVRSKFEISVPRHRLIFPLRARLSVMEPVEMLLRSACASEGELSCLRACSVDHTCTARSVDTSLFFNTLIPVDCIAKQCNYCSHFPGVHWYTVSVVV
jgi:hypothetical protein